MIKSQRRALCLFSLGTFYMHMQSVPAGLMKSDLKSRALSVNPPLSRGTLCLIKQKKSRWSHRQTRYHLLGRVIESQVVANLDTYKRCSVSERIGLKAYRYPAPSPSNVTSAHGSFSSIRGGRHASFNHSESLVNTFSSD